MTCRDPIKSRGQLRLENLDIVSRRSRRVMEVVGAVEILEIDMTEWTGHRKVWRVDCGVEGGNGGAGDS